MWTNCAPTGAKMKIEIAITSFSESAGDSLLVDEDGLRSGSSCAVRPVRTARLPLYARVAALEYDGSSLGRDHPRVIEITARQVAWFMGCTCASLPLPREH